MLVWFEWSIFTLQKLKKLKIPFPCFCTADTSLLIFSYKNGTQMVILFLSISV